MFSWNNGKFVISKIFNLRILADGFVCCVWETSFILQTTNENILPTPPPSLCTQQTNCHQLWRRLKVLGNSVFCCMNQGWKWFSIQAYKIILIIQSTFYIVSLSRLKCSIGIVYFFKYKFLCFSYNKIKCVTGLLFYMVHGILPREELSRVMSELGSRREGWGIGQSTRSPSMCPWFRSWYVNHTCVRFSFLIFLPQIKYCYAEFSVIWKQLSDVEQIAALLCQIFYVLMECFLQTQTTEFKRGHPRL